MRRRIERAVFSAPSRAEYSKTSRRQHHHPFTPAAVLTVKSASPWAEGRTLTGVINRCSAEVLASELRRVHLIHNLSHKTPALVRIFPCGGRDVMDEWRASPPREAYLPLQEVFPK